MGRIKCTASRSRRWGARAVAALLLAAIASSAASAAALAATRGHGDAVVIPPFTVFGWVSPPAESTTLARIEEMAAAGLTLLLPASLDQGLLEDNLRRLDFAAAAGLRALIWDSRFERVDTATVAGRATLDSIVASYRDHKGFFGHYLGDEPPPERLPLLDSLFQALRARDPGHPPWNNLLGRGAYASAAEYEQSLRHYVDRMGPDVLCADHYDLLIGGDRGLFVENLVVLSRVARAYGLPFWVIVQLVPHGAFRTLTPGELRWQVGQSLAYGTRGIGYFTWWTPLDDAFTWGPAVIGSDGRRTFWYDVLRTMNPEVHAIGATLASSRWISTVHAGSTPAGAEPFVPGGEIASVAGRAALGRFTGADGRWLLLVAASDSLAASTVSLDLVGLDDVERFTSGSGWSSAPWTAHGDRVRVAVGLEPGGFALLSARRAVLPLRLRLTPNPAAGPVAIHYEGAIPGSDLEIVDVRGRRVAGVRLGATAGVATWSGADDRGGNAKPGLYFARVSGDAGLRSARFAWLGAR